MHGSYSLYSNLCTNITSCKGSIIGVKSEISDILVQKIFRSALKQIRHIVHSTRPMKVSAQAPSCGVRLRLRRSAGMSGGNPHFAASVSRVG